MSMSENEALNLEKGLDALREAAAHGADLILYPELQLHRFFPQYEKLDVADKLLTAEHPIVQQFRSACRTHRIMAAPNFYMKEPCGSFDTTRLIGSDGALLRWQKMVHIAQAGSGDELLYAQVDMARIRAERPYTSLRRPKLYR